MLPSKFDTKNTTISKIDNYATRSKFTFRKSRKLGQFEERRGCVKMACECQRPELWELRCEEESLVKSIRDVPSSRTTLASIQFLQWTQDPDPYEGFTGVPIEGTLTVRANTTALGSTVEIPNLTATNWVINEGEPIVIQVGESTATVKIRFISDTPTIDPYEFQAFSSIVSGKAYNLEIENTIFELRVRVLQGTDVTAFDAVVYPNGRTTSKVVKACSGKPVSMLAEVYLPTPATAGIIVTTDTPNWSCNIFINPGDKVGAGTATFTPPLGTSSSKDSNGNYITEYQDLNFILVPNSGNVPTPVEYKITVAYIVYDDMQLALASYATIDNNSPQPFDPSAPFPILVTQPGGPDPYKNTHLTVKGTFTFTNTAEQASSDPPSVAVAIFDHVFIINPAFGPLFNPTGFTVVVPGGEKVGTNTFDITSFPVPGNQSFDLPPKINTTITNIDAASAACTAERFLLKIGSFYSYLIQPVTEIRWFVNNGNITNIVDFKQELPPKILRLGEDPEITDPLTLYSTQKMLKYGATAASPLIVKVTMTVTNLGGKGVGTIIDTVDPNTEVTEANFEAWSSTNINETINSFRLKLTPTAIGDGTITVSQTVQPSDCENVDYTWLNGGTVPPGDRVWTLAQPITVIAGPPGPVTNLNAVIGVNALEVRITWDPVTTDNGNPISGYKWRITGGVWSGPIPLNPREVITTAGMVAQQPYTFEVRAINSSGDGAIAVSNVVTPINVPNAPPFVSAVVGGSGQVKIAWGAPNSNGATITGYEMNNSLNPNWVPASLPSETVSGLEAQAGVNTSFGIRATCAAPAPNVGAEAQGFCVVAVTPSPPTNFTVTQIQSGAAELQWGAPADLKGSIIDGYKYQVDNGAITSVGPTVLSAQVFGLQSGSHDFKVLAHADRGVGDGETATVTLDIATAPGKPTNFVGAISGSGEVTLNWAAPSTTNGAVLDGRYKLRYGTPTPNTTIFIDAVTTVVQNLTGGQTYTFALSANSNVGYGPEEVITVAVASTPSAPTSLVAVNTGNPFEINITWNQPANANNCNIINYEYKVDNGAYQAAVPRSEIISGLSEGPHTFYVTAIGFVGGLQIGTSDPAIVNSIVLSPPGPVQSLAAVQNGSGRIRVTWSPPLLTPTTAAPTGYMIKKGADPYQNATSPSDYNNLTGGQTYTFTIKAVSDVGDGAEATVTADAATAPDPPTTLAAVSVDPLGESAPVRIQLTWSDPADLNGAVVDYYQYRYKTNSSGWSAPVTINSNVPIPYNIVGGAVDQPGALFSFEVKIVPLNGIPPSNWSTKVSGVLAAKRPGAPTNLTVSNPTAGVVSANWTSGPDNYSNVTGWLYTEGAELPPGSSTGKPMNLTNVPSGTYTYYIRQNSDLGIGAPSPGGTVIVNTLPAAPATISAISPSPGVINFTWTPPNDLGGPGTSIIAYEITYTGPAASPASPYVSTVVTPPLSLSLTGATGGQPYVVTIKAKNNKFDDWGTGIDSAQVIPA